jgi:TPR repeat protein
MSGHMQTQEKTPLERGYDLMNEGKYEEALPLLRSLADQGSEYACLYLAWLYQMGLGVAKDQAEAEKLYRAVADTGSPMGQHYLGNLLRKLEQFEQAFKWHEQAAKAGYLPAIYRLSKMYGVGQGVDRNEIKAQQYLQEAAMKEHLFARRDIAVQMLKGRFGYMKIPLGVTKWIAVVVGGFCLAIKDADSEKLR